MLKLEEGLIKYCAPTLAGVKVAGMFSFYYAFGQDLCYAIRRLNQKLSGRGIVIIPLYKGQGRALIYVFCKLMLSHYLMKPEIKSFLYKRGYNYQNFISALTLLRKHFLLDNFPHEVGAFLGYPIGDVIGFIENKGRNMLLTGCWKVYQNKEEAIRLFKKYHECKKNYEMLWQQGKNIFD